MGWFDNWSMDNFLKSLSTPGPSNPEVIGQAVNKSLEQRGAKQLDLGTGKQQLPNLTSFQSGGQADVGMANAVANQRSQAEGDAQRMQQEERERQAAQQAAAKEAYEAPLRGSNFLQALQSQEPSMFRPKKRKQAEWGSPLGGL